MLTPKGFCRVLTRDVQRQGGWLVITYLKRLLESKKILTLYFAGNSTDIACLLTISKGMLTDNPGLLAGKVVNC